MSKSTRGARPNCSLQPDQLAALKDDAKNEQVCLLKSLAKLLVDNVEAACAKQGRGPYLALTAPHTSASSQDQTLALASMKVHVDKQHSLLSSSSYGHVLYVILWNEIMTDTFNHVLNCQNWQTKCGAPEFQLDTKTITENHELRTCIVANPLSVGIGRTVPTVCPHAIKGGLIAEVVKSIMEMLL